jgi:predicted RNase H-like nuclease
VKVHPELSFAVWHGSPMQHGKHERAGREERRRLIRGRLAGSCGGAL